MNWTKYGNRKTYVGTELFDSKHEADRWVELTLMQKAGEISDLKRQVPFLLIPEIRNKTTGKVISRKTEYIADFTYTKNGKTVIEDAKSEATRTQVYLLKKKLLLWRYGILIREV